jgi:hypothetical protein
VVGVGVAGDQEIDLVDVHFVEQPCGIALAGVDERGLAFWRSDQDGVALSDVQEGDLDGGGVLSWLLGGGGEREGEEERGD